MTLRSATSRSIVSKHSLRNSVGGAHSNHNSYRENVTANKASKRPVGNVTEFKQNACLNGIFVLLKLCSTKGEV